jgi:NAD(P)-dependent dehydrogenase (short-subunit alcohol dehydrogenase family)
MSAEAHSGDENAIHGKVVVMTGATSGIGQVAAEHLAKSGARIILWPAIRNGPRSRSIDCRRYRPAGITFLIMPISQAFPK